MIQKGFTWIIEGGVKACFGDISHRAILDAVREKVMDNKFLALIDLFLKSGVEIDGKFHPTTKGVPQGGVVSPLLANAVLNKLDWFLHDKARLGLSGRRASRKREPNLRFARYADDWVVLITWANKRYAESLKEEIRELLETRCGLRLSLEKTKITHARDGFDFLGFHLESGIGRSGKRIAKIKVCRKSTMDIKHRLEESIRFCPSQDSIACRLSRANAMIRGWSNYFRIATISVAWDTDWITTCIGCWSRRFVRSTT